MMSKINVRLRSSIAAALTAVGVVIRPIQAIVAGYAEYRDNWTIPTYVNGETVLYSNSEFFCGLAIDNAADGSILAVDCHLRHIYRLPADKSMIGSLWPDPYGHRISICADPFSDGGYVIAGFSNVRRFDGQTITDLAGNRYSGYADGTGTDAKFVEISGVVSDGRTVFVTDKRNHRLRSIDGTGTVRTIAGDGYDRIIDGYGTAASICQPDALTVDRSLAVVFVTAASSIRRFDIATGQLTTLQLKRPIYPRFIASAPSGLLIISCRKTLTFVVVDPSTGAVDALDGSAVPEPDGRNPSDAVQFSFCTALAVDAVTERLWLASSDRVRWLPLASRFF